jgi:hypothetical protein
MRLRSRVIRAKSARGRERLLTVRLASSRIHHDPPVPRRERTRGQGPRVRGIHQGRVPAAGHDPGAGVGAYIEALKASGAGDPKPLAGRLSGLVAKRTHDCVKFRRS